jgi:hypothetical protein
MELRPWRTERAASHLGASSSSAPWPGPPAGAAHRTHKTDAQEHESSSEDGSGGTHHQHPASFQQQENTCWSCHDRHKRGSLLCQSCDKIQPVDSSLTYFDLLGM